MLQRSPFSTVLTVAFLAATLGAAHAQSESLTATTANAPGPTGTLPGPGTVLWDNTAINSVGNGIVSLKAQDLPDGANLVNTADDFVVPDGEQWNITFVFSTGFPSAGSVDANAFEVFFYEDAGGLPGSLITSQQVPLGGSVTMTEQQITLPTPVSLEPGTYWVSVAGVYDPFVDLATTRWNWATGDVAIGNDAALQDTGAFFGSAIPWTDLPTLGVTDVSTAFALRGTSVAAAQQIPTLGSGGIIALVLLLAFIGVVAVRRMA